MSDEYSPTRLWFRYSGVYVCAPPKCGGTALYCAALGIDPALGNRVFERARELAEFVEPDQVEPPAVLAVRDPVERFASLWRNKCRDGDPNYPQLAGLSPMKLLEMIRANPVANAHWIPQSAFHRPGADVVDYRILGPFLGLGELRVNETVRLDSDQIGRAHV